jgi:hypothetical protein
VDVVRGGSTPPAGTKIYNRLICNELIGFSLSGSWFGMKNLIASKLSTDFHFANIVSRSCARRGRSFNCSIMFFVGKQRWYFFSTKYLNPLDFTILQVRFWSWLAYMNASVVYSVGAFYWLVFLGWV